MAELKFFTLSQMSNTHHWSKLNSKASIVPEIKNKTFKPPALSGLGEIRGMLSKVAFGYKKKKKLCKKTLSKTAMGRVTPPTRQQNFNGFPEVSSCHSVFYPYHTDFLNQHKNTFQMGVTSLCPAQGSFQEF